MEFPLMPPAAVLRAGAEILAPALVPHGFRFRLVVTGRGSGGAFAVGEYVRGDRRLEFHFRYSLGLVTYHVGSLAVPHEALMRAVVPPGERTAYPGFSADPLDGFRHLREDLARYATTFVTGSDDAALTVLSRALELERAKPRGLKALSDPRIV